MKINIQIEADTDHPAFVNVADALAVLAGYRVTEVRGITVGVPTGGPDQPAAPAEPAAPVEPAKRTRRTKAEMEAAAAPAPEQQTELPVEEPAPTPAEPAPAPAAAPATAVPDFAAVKAAAVDLVNKHGGEIQSALTKFISVQFKDADGNPARLFTLTDDGRAKTMATVQACAALADKDAILKHLAV